MNSKPKPHAAFDKDIWPQIQYHNERIYKNLEMFLQITLAICGGLAYLAVNKISANPEAISIVIRLAAYLQLFVGAYTVIAIFHHVISKVRRYANKSSLIRKSFGWLEPYMILFVLSISLIIAYFAWFQLARVIVTKP
ncbi:MAG: hypothetical protein NTX45_19125 [Proteobacteria bacterium]|nr:hypothetical protein [Pseudomonadota bacterium]